MNPEAKLNETAKRHQSTAGYWFDEDDSIWRLNKNVKVNVGAVRSLLDSESGYSFTATLAHYASTKSATHTQNMAQDISLMLKVTATSSISVTTLLNYRATLTRATECRLGSVSGFICTWHDLGYPGIDDDVVDLLEGWTLRPNIKGDAIKRLDPLEGPFTDNELIAFNDGAVCAFDKGRITITDLSISLLTSNTGRDQSKLRISKSVILTTPRRTKRVIRST
jgi:hypothetical protein